MTTQPNRTLLELLNAYEQQHEFMADQRFLVPGSPVEGRYWTAA